jgi:ADP-ribosylglycohydrolase
MAARTAGRLLKGGCMLGAISGDIIGSIYEFDNIKSTEFPLFGDNCSFTDDSVLSVALAETILSGGSYEALLREYYGRYPDVSYGGIFRAWARGKISGPYQSYGNGAAMRISPAGWAFDSLDDVLQRSREYTMITHDHPEGIKGAQATAAAIFLGRSGAAKDDIRRYVEQAFDYDLSCSCDQIRPRYRFDVSCQGSVPPAIIAFLESSDFESAVRLAVSLGGDSDTLACISGAIAEAFYDGVPEWIGERALAILDQPLRDVTLRFIDRYVRRGEGARPSESHPPDGPCRR